MDSPWEVLAKSVDDADYPVNAPIRCDRIQYQPLAPPELATFIFRRGELLEPLCGRVVADEIIKNRQHVPAILDHPLKQRTQPRFLDRFPIPFGKYRCRHPYVPAKLFRRVAAQK